MDLKGFDPTLQRFKTEAGQPLVVYPAPMMCAYFLLSRMSSNTVALYTGFVVLVAATLTALFGLIVYRSSLTNRSLLAFAAVVAVPTYYPLLFDIERSNMEAVVWVAVLIAVTALLCRWYKTAAVFVALAASMKLYPGILLLIFLKEKRYRDLALACAAFAGITLAALWISNPNIVAAHNEVTSGLSVLNKGHVSGYIAKEIGFDHSLFSPVKLALRFLYPDLARFHRELLNEKVAVAVRVYTPLVVIGFALAYGFWIRKRPLTNQVVMLLILSITLPMMSLEYTLLQVFPALIILFLFLIESTNRDKVIPVQWTCAFLISFAVLATPYTWFGGLTAQYGGQLKLLALTTMFVFACLFSMESASELLIRQRFLGPNEPKLRLS